MDRPQEARKSENFNNLLIIFSDLFQFLRNSFFFSSKTQLFTVLFILATNPLIIYNLFLKDFLLQTRSEKSMVIISNILKNLKTREIACNMCFFFLF